MTCGGDALSLVRRGLPHVIVLVHVLAFGTVDSIMGKMRAIFNDAARRGDWDPRLQLGNPASDSSLNKYLKAVTSEQLQARTLPTQATPLFADDLLQLCMIGNSSVKTSPL